MFSLLVTYSASACQYFVLAMGHPLRNALSSAPFFATRLRAESAAMKASKIIEVHKAVSGGVSCKH